MKISLNHRIAFIFAAATIAITATAAAAEPEFYPRAPIGNITPPFSEAVRVGDMLYLSGELGVDATGKIVPGGVKAETKQLMDNIGANLARHHSSFDRVVQCQVALADIADWPAFNEVYKPYFSKHFPARMAYAASGLALGGKVEVQCNAVVSP
jgi:2-iminobutanoate/2-iminopropanoate deaminase